MTKLHYLVLPVAAMALAAGIFAGFEFSRAANARAAQAAVLGSVRDLQGKLARLTERHAVETKRANAIEADNKLLSEALAQARTAQQAKAAQAEAPMTRQEVEERFRRATLLAKNGDPAEALRELLWCWQEGPRRLASNSPVAVTQVLTAIRALGDLAERYPAALEALRERRDPLRQRVLSGPGGNDAVSELTAVLTALKEDGAILDVFDELPAGDRRRTSLAIYGFDTLVEARRYGDAMLGRSYAMMNTRFEIETQGRTLPQGIPNAEQMIAAMRSRTIASTAKSVEVLAGSGDVAHARILADRLLAFDNTEATKALIVQHATRAGKPELLSVPAR